MDAVLPRGLQLCGARLRENTGVYNFGYSCEITKMEDKQNCHIQSCAFLCLILTCLCLGNVVLSVIA